MKRFPRAFILATALCLNASTPSAGAALPFRQTGVGGAWSATGSLTIPRVSAMAVTLPSSKVLIAGGFSATATLASAELYDPQKGRWSPARAMALARYNATMTLLPNGKVLVAGGLIDSSPGVTAGAEVYDPATGRWSRTGAMVAARANHTATVLSNGKVLVAGGVGIQQNQTIALASAELYDPATGIWSATGSMAKGHERHGAARLATGQVLVSGGSLDYLDGAEGSAETYDPNSRRWSLAGRMMTSRASHSTTALGDGTVLVAGGWYGNVAGSNQLAMSDRYDPTTRRWSGTGDMQIDVGSIPTISGREHHTATLLTDGRVLVAGGDGYLTDFTVNVAFSSAELYDPTPGTWALTGRMTTTRSEHVAAALADGRVLVAGGSDGHANALASAEIYTPPTRHFVAWTSWRTRSASALEPLHSGPNVAEISAPPVDRKRHALGAASGRTSIGKWTQTGSMHVPRVGAPPATLLQNGKVLIEGCDASGPGNTAELYDPVSRKWSMTGSMNVARCAHKAVLMADGRVLVAAGHGTGSDVLPTVEIYDPSTGRWTTNGRLNSTRQFSAILTLSNGKLLVPAGAAINTIPRDSADLYDPAAGTGVETPSLNLSRWDFGAALLPSGKVLVQGGFTQNNSVTLTSELYDPATNAWAFTGSTHQEPGPGNIVALKNGLVLATDEPGNGPSGITSELYDPATGKWTPTIGKMHFPRAADAITELADGRVLVSGGCFGISCILVAQAEAYNPASQRWLLDAPLVMPREDHSAVLLSDGTVLVAGGYGAHFQALTSAEIYTPGVAGERLRSTRR